MRDAIILIFANKQDLPDGKEINRVRLWMCVGRGLDLLKYDTTQMLFLPPNNYDPIVCVFLHFTDNYVMIFTLLSLYMIKSILFKTFRPNKIFELFFLEIFQIFSRLSGMPFNIYLLWQCTRKTSYIRLINVYLQL